MAQSSERFKHGEGDLQDEELQRFREQLTMMRPSDLAKLRMEAQERVGALVAQILNKENVPLEARAQALQRLFRSFRDIEMAIDNAGRAGGELP